ncbi:MAG: hypothetical protein QXJ46_04880, partial [Candidatus Bathyarchaeia archaeon]
GLLSRGSGVQLPPGPPILNRLFLEYFWVFKYSLGGEVGEEGEAIREDREVSMLIRAFDLTVVYGLQI